MFSFGVPRLVGREFYPYERITNISTQRCVDNARRILKTGWSVGKSVPVRVGRDSIDWTISDPKSRSWACALHCWNMLDVPLAAYSETGEDHFLTPCLEVALEWAELHQNTRSVSEFSWYDMAVGMRAYRLAYLIDAANNKRLLNRSQLRLLWRCMLKHARHLVAEKNITYQNNHGYYQIAGQLALGRRFASVSKELSEAHRLGLNRLHRILALHFTEEGVHKEHSPDYHRMVYETLKGLLDAGLVTDPELTERALKIEQVLAWFVYPDGILVNFGDSPSRDMRRPVEEARTKWRTPEMQFVASSGQAGAFFDSPVGSFLRSGYWIIRVDSKDASLGESQASYLAHAAAFHSRTHKHADDLNFVWFDQGVPILTDAGRYGYIGKTKKLSKLWLDGFWYSDENRIYCESTRAHNTLEFDGRNFKRRGVKPFGSAIESFGESSGVYFCWSRCKEFDSIVYDRFLIFKPGCWLWVVDNFEDIKGHGHDVRQCFNISSLHSVVKNGKEFTIHLNKSRCDMAPPLTVLSASESPVDEDFFFGDESPEMRGWISESDGEIKPSPAFQYAIRGQSQGRFKTLFIFSSNAEVKKSESNDRDETISEVLVWRDGKEEQSLAFSAHAKHGMKLSIDN